MALDLRRPRDRRRCSSRSLALALLREPARGRYEQELVLGEVLDAVGRRAAELPVSMSTAYQRLKKIKTFYFICVGIGVLGFALVAVPVQLGLLLDDSYGYGAYTRGWMLSLTAIASLAAIPIAGLDVRPAVPAQIPSWSCGWRACSSSRYGAAAARSRCGCTESRCCSSFVALAGACTSAAFVSVGPIVGAVAPYRMRTQAFALVPVFIFLMGGFFGGLLAGALSDAHGERTALTIVAPIAGTIGGLLFMYGSRFLKRDISLAVEELLEEQSEHRADERAPGRDPGAAGPQPRLQLRAGAGAVRRRASRCQRGEVLALLGTNGAGKSTLLRGDQRARHPRPRRRAAQRPHAHLRRRRGPVPAGHRAAARRRGRVPAS